MYVETEGASILYQRNNECVTISVVLMRYLRSWLPLVERIRAGCKRVILCQMTGL